MRSTRTLRLPGCICLAAIATILAISPAYAGSATWSLNPTSGDWTIPANWNPATVPDSQTDIATFGISTVTAVSLSSSIDVDSIIFVQNASAYSLGVNFPGIALNFYGAGVVNNSGVAQNISTSQDIIFYNNASAGDMVNYVSSGVFTDGIIFNDFSSAGNASFSISGSTLTFNADSTAANANITINALGEMQFRSTTSNTAKVTTNSGGVTYIAGSADHGTFTSNGAPSSGVGGGSTVLEADGAEGLFIANGGNVSGAQGGILAIELSGDGGDGTYVVNGGTVTGAEGAVMTVTTKATAGNAYVTVNGGTNGGDPGLLSFTGLPHGGTASIALDGGSLDISAIQKRISPLETGSLAGAGTVSLGSRQLQLGTNNQTTIFSGIIQDGGLNGGTGGSLSKIGTGTLTLSGASTYSGGTSVSAGALVASNTTGSATGPGAVSVSAGTLGGAGIIAGAVTIGDGTGTAAFLAPSVGVTGPTTMTIQSALTFKSDSTYTCKATPKADQIVANGVTIESGAQFTLAPLAGAKVKVGQKATVISNTAATPIAGTFTNLPDSTILTVGSYHIQASYEGGDGNDLTLTVVP